MSLKIKCHSKGNVSQNEMSLKIECHSKWNIKLTQNKMSPKWNVTENAKSQKMEYD